MPAENDKVVKHPSAEDPLNFSSDFDAFVYHIAHDVRASARALTELPNWVQEDLRDAGVEVPRTVQDSLGLMQRHSKRLDRILSDLLTYSRIGRMQRIMEQELAPAIANVLHDMAVPKSFRITTDLAAPKIKIGERDLERLLVALLSNPIKHRYQEVGIIRIESSIHNGHVRLVISDDGAGIEPRYQERVFAMMTTLRPRDEIEGSGMGLAIAQKICATYGGSIELSSPGREGGCTFTVDIPQ